MIDKLDEDKVDLRKTIVDFLVQPFFCFNIFDLLKGWFKSEICLLPKCIVRVAERAFADWQILTSFRNREDRLDTNKESDHWYF